MIRTGSTLMLISDNMYVLTMSEMGRRYVVACAKHATLIGDLF